VTIEFKTGSVTDKIAVGCSELVAGQV